ncbi:MAG TPA: hypothetical protein VFO66_10485 [Gemmatimonadaceae bacterium]|nr:hypothetical protein [Gemmatimonadaceae bacterium]
MKVLAAILVTTVAASLQAQVDARANLAYPHAQRVRVAAPTILRKPVVARVASVDSGHLALTVTRAGTALAIPYGAITRIEASGGIDRGRGMRRGAIAGLALGGLFFATTYPEIRGSDYWGLGFLAMSLVSFGIAPGAGAMIGYFAAPETWNPLQVPVPSASAPLAIRFAAEEHVRFRTRSATLDGRVVSQTPTRLEVATNGGNVAVPWRDVASVQVRGGRNRWRGAAIGALVGIGVGILGEQSAPTTSTSERVAAFTGSAIVFGYLGSRFLAPAGWSDLPLPPATP